MADGPAVRIINRDGPRDTTVEVDGQLLSNVTRLSVAQAAGDLPHVVIERVIVDEGLVVDIANAQVTVVNQSICGCGHECEEDDDAVGDDR